MAITAPALASEPPSHDVTAPTSLGETVEVTWTGLIPPGGNSTSDCATQPRELSDPHTIELTVPPGTYDGLAVRMTATITPTGATASSTDVIVSLITPAGTSVAGDSGFVDVAESAGVTNPAAGTYEVLACAFAAPTPAEYEGKLVLEGVEPFSGPTGVACAPPSPTPKFEMGYIDTTRAGGEPFIITHPEGHLLWGSHAGTTHFYSPTAPSPSSGAFAENYEGQTYYYHLDPEEGWVFVPRQGPSEDDLATVAGQPASGFSDPEFAVDQAGNVFISEINLANVAVSKSTDGGRSYALQNTFAFTQSDRQWMAADREDELYMAASGFGGGPFPGEPVGQTEHFLAKSTDGGVTWNGPFTIDPIVGDLQLDQDRGILYSLHHDTETGTLGIARFPNIRDELSDFTVEVLPIAENTGMSGVQRLIGPTLAMDVEGNLYVTWSENGTGTRPQGIYYAASTDQGTTWSVPQRVDPDGRAAIWPWLDVGAPGQVVVAWLQGDQQVPATLPGEDGGDDVKWNVAVAHTSSGLGCADGDVPAFTVTQASSEAIHTGTICQHGTTCQADLTDRRLGDYFSVTVDDAGFVHVAVSDTRQGGAVALPLHIRQVSGVTLDAPPEPPQPVPPPEPAPEPEPLPATGGGVALLGIGLALIAAAPRRRRS